MDNIFGKMLDSIMNKKSGASTGGGSLRDSKNLPDLDRGTLGGILGSILGGGGGGSSKSGGAKNSGSGGLGGMFGKTSGGLAGFSLSYLVRKMMSQGMSSIIKSWVGKGPNHLISPDQIKSTIGSEQLNQLANQYGLSTDQLSHVLAEHLPDAVDQLTPDGELKDDTGNVIDLSAFADTQAKPMLNTETEAV